VISSIRLQNYRNHKDTEIEFGDLTALVGPNSAGKSNVLEAIRCFMELPDRGKFFDVFGRERAPMFLVRHGQRSFALEIESRTPKWSLRAELTLPPEPADEDDDPDLRATLNRGGEEPLSFSWTDSFEEGAPDEVLRSLRGIRYLRATAENLSEPSRQREVPPQLQANGKRLPSVVSYLMTTEPDRFKRFVDQLRVIVPEVKGVRTRPSVRDGGGVEEHELLYDMKGGSGIPANSASDGTLIATGMLAALTGTKGEEPHFLMIDDLEQGLHPKAQRELVSVLRKILDQRPDLQIVFTTHSPYIVDELAPEETWLLNTDADGVAHARRLSEHPDAEKSLQVLTTGEFWSAEGEDWVVGDGASDEASAQPSAE
jgi:predicted ATPase